MSGLGYGVQESVPIKQPDAPTQVGQVVVLFDSAVMFGPGQLRQMNATMVEITPEILSNDSAANGLITYSSSNGGTTYTANTMRDGAGTATTPFTVVAAEAPRTYSFVISAFREFKATFTTGVIPTTWTWTIVVHCGGLAVQK